MTHPTDPKAQEMAEEEFFELHACLTGDCPHWKTLGCLTAAYLAGHRSRDAEIEALKAENERLRSIIEEIQSYCKDAITFVALEDSVDFTLGKCSEALNPPAPKGEK